jgi:hypothetical protein
MSFMFYPYEEQNSSLIVVKERNMSNKRWKQK